MQRFLRTQIHSIAGWSIASVLFSFVSLPSASRGQSNLSDGWWRVGGFSIDPSYYVTAIYFSDTVHGVAAFKPPETDSGAEIYYTLTGKQWKLASMPSGVTWVRRIRPIAGKLYAATEGPDVLVSTNNGISWNFAGLGLANTFDVYADPSGTIHALTDPMRCFARVDGLHCVEAGIANQARISTDGGDTWRDIIIGNDSATYFSSNIGTFGTVSVYGDTCAHVFIYHSDQGEVYRSTDYGATWTNTLVGSGWLPELIEGTDNVAYVSTEQGLYRTLDDGLNWWGINSVYSGPDVFCVLGPMGNDVATHDVSARYQHIWMTKDGGDDILRSPIELYDAFLNLVDTLYLAPECPGLRVPIPLEIDIDSLVTTVTIASDSLSEFTIKGPTVFHLQSGVPDTAWVEYTPHAVPESITVNLLFQHSWHCSQWDEMRTIVVTTGTIASIAMPSTISGNCSIVDADGTISFNTQCKPLVISSVTSSIPSLTSTATFPDTIISASAPLPFQFNPGNSNINEIDTVEIKGYYAGTTTTFDTILTVLLLGSATAPQLSTLNEIGFDTLNTCRGARDTSILYNNRGCVTDTIITVSTTDSAFLWIAQSLPIILPPGDSTTLLYRFAPRDTTGTYSGFANVIVVSNGDTENVSVQLFGVAIQNPGQAAIATPLVECGSPSPCTGDTVLSDTISNTGCDTLLISEIKCYNDTSFSLLAPSNDTLVLAPGASGVLQFLFAPRSQGEHDGVLNFNSRIIHNFASNDMGIFLRGMGLAGAKLLSANVQTIDMGSFYGCQQGESRDTTITLYNTGCDSVTIDNPYFSNQEYTLASRRIFKIPPDTLSIVKIHFTLDTANNFPGTITFPNDADTGASASPLGPITLTASIIQPAQLQLTLSPAQVAHAGQVVTFYVILSGDTGAAAKGLTGINFNLAHNNDLLSYLSASGVTRQGTGGTPALQVDTFAWSASSMAQSPDTIGMLTFQVYLTDSSTTPLTLSNISFDNTLGLAPDCIASIDAASSGFTYLYQCGEKLIQDKMLGLPIEITSIVPNPAASSISVGVRDAGAGGAIELYDALGRKVMTLHDLANRGTDGSVSEYAVDVSTLPAGVYTVRYLLGSYSYGRPVVIVH